MTDRRPNMRHDEDADDATDARIGAALRDYLASEPERAPDHLLATTIDRRRGRAQRSPLWSRWLPMVSGPIAAGVAAAVVVFAVVVGTAPDRGPGSSAPALDPTRSASQPASASQPSFPPVRVGATLALEGAALAIATDGDRGWALRAAGLVRFTATSVGSLVPTDVQEPREITVAAGRPWVTGAGSALVTVSPRTEQMIRYGVGIDGDLVAASPTAVWVSGLSAVRRLEIASGNVTTLPLSGVLAMAAGDDLLWTVRDTGSIVASDPLTGGEVFVVPGQMGPQQVAGITIVAGSVWAIDPANATRILRIDESTGEVIGTVQLGAAATRLAVGPERLWVLADRASLLSAVDLATLTVVETVAVPGNVSDLAVLTDRPVLLELDRLLVVNPGRD